jgi:Uma2 family endonuclease
VRPRDVKVPLYARHGVPEVWIVDLQSKRLVVYSSLANNKYESRNELAGVEVMPLPSLLDASVDLSRLFEE